MKVDWNLNGLLAEKGAIRDDWDTTLKKEPTSVANEWETFACRVAVGAMKEIDASFTRAVRDPHQRLFHLERPFHRTISFSITDAKSAKELVRLSQGVEDLPIISEWLQYFSNTDKSEEAQLMNEWKKASVLDCAYFNGHMKKVSLEVEEMLRDHFQACQKAPENHRFAFKVSSQNGSSSLNPSSCVDESDRNDIRIKLWVSDETGALQEKRRVEKREWINQAACAAFVAVVFSGFAYAEHVKRTIL